MKIQKIASLFSAATVVAALSFSAPAVSQSAGMAMTWATYDIQNTATPAKQALWAAMSANLLATTGMRPTLVGCVADVPNYCDAYNGDMDENERRRILCFVPGVPVNPAIVPQPLVEPAEWAQILAYNPAATGSAMSDWRYYLGWTGGRFGLTLRVKGSDILSQADGDAKCKDATIGLGDPNAVMAEHHVSGGAWGAGGLIHPNSKVPNQLQFGNQTLVDSAGGNPGYPPRFWVAIVGQNANPWNNPN